MTVDTQCGIRCAGRAEQMISWVKPSQSRLVTVGRATSYLDLIRTSNFISGDDGIYTCIVDNGTYIKYIGIYNRQPGEM